jgi:hypothetical protein
MTLSWQRPGVRTLLFCLGACLLFTMADSQLPTVPGQQPVCFQPTPAVPFRINRPNNWSDTQRAECPRKCQSCCTAAWDQLTFLMSMMPRENCSYCLMMRYALGTWDYTPEETKCPQCLMDDFAKVVSNFGCNQDNGECQKCCMDLSTIYMARFIEPCPEKIWRDMSKFKYKSGGIAFQGCSSCNPEDVPNATLPSPSPQRWRTKLDLSWKNPTKDEAGYDFNYLRLEDVQAVGQP